ncbi:hypothetical protein LBMAG47_28920 [Planctomycetia bacterium]|nr:hypothetical protein LBMAG47_28920 [Planctomycetia bacterium]
MTVVARPPQFTGDESRGIHAMNDADTQLNRTNLATEPLWPLGLGALGITVVAIAYGLVLSGVFNDWSSRGQFGDMFGALNTFFSGLAFAALAYTLLLQRKELALQRIELAQTRDELARQAEAQAAHAATALRAAEITAAGSLFQSYAQLISGNKQFLINNDDWQAEIMRARDRLLKLLAELEKARAE